MSDMDRSKALREAFERAVDAEHEALKAGVRAEELEKAPSKGFERRMKALFEQKEKKRMPAVWRRALITAAALAAAIGVMALLGVFKRDPNGIKDVQNNTPVPVSAVPLTEAPPSAPPTDALPLTERPTDVLPSDTPSWTAFVPMTGTPAPTGQGTLPPVTAGPTDRPTPMPTEPPTGTPLPVTEPPTLPTEPPILPTEPPVLPTEPPIMPTDIPPQPSDLPTEPPVEPTDEPTEPPAEPTCEPPVEPTCEPPEFTPSPYQPGEIITFGRYEQDNSASNGAEEIEWIVLSVTNGKMLVISRYALDAVPYNDAPGDITWILCTLRTGFMRSFLNEAFTAEERSRIILHYVQTPANPVYGTPGGNNAFDRLFLLSINEASSLMSMSLRRCEATAYARARGVNIYGGYCDWWLRSPGSLASTAAYADYRGRIDNEGAPVQTGYFGVRPAMWISIP